MADQLRAEDDLHLAPVVAWLATDRPELGSSHDTWWDGTGGSAVLVVGHCRYLSAEHEPDLDRTPIPSRDETWGPQRRAEERAMETLTPSRPHEGLMTWLRAHEVEHEIHEHDLAFTARQTARAEGVDPRTFAKVVGVRTDDGRRALLVLDATDHVDLAKARRALAATGVRVLDEIELTALAPTCETGAIPAVGALFGLPMYADFAVRDDREISFNAGSHEVSVRVDREALERTSQVRYADLAADTDRRPAWARS